MNDPKLPIVVSGMRPTGRLHLGHLHGAIANWVKLQETTRAHFFSADWHALTTSYHETEKLKQAEFEMFVDFLAAGIDPERTVLFVQSHRTAITLGAARGAAILALAQRGISVFEYAPTDVKQAVVGRGGAAKDQVAFMVRALLGLTETPDADAADALAIGLTHLQSHDSARMGVKTLRQI